ncbi:MAG: hypothetical protein R3Y39_08015 [Rikenellaceae bacterium]
MKITDFVACAIVMITPLSAQSVDEYSWSELTPNGEAVGRHECVFMEYGDKFYLMGGRGVKPVNRYDPQRNSWETLNKTPIEINHFQAVEYNDLIYVVCAMNGSYPVEKPLTNVWIYDPQSDEWREGDPIPVEHQRGGGGAVLYDGKIYIACGIEYGHTSGTTNIFSCYDPESGEWSSLTKAPHIRDHFAAIVVQDKLYCIGGRNSSVHYPGNFGAFFNATTPEVDVYDFEQGKWYTLPNNLPTPTAAGGVVEIDGEIIYMGGEGSDPLAYNQTQCLNLDSGEWRELSPMVQGMHGSGAIEYDGKVYWAAGSYKQGGSNLNTIQLFSK